MSGDNKRVRRRHRIILDITMEFGCDERTVCAAVMEAVANYKALVGIQVVRPLSYRKVLTVTARMENDQILADVETAIDHLREASKRLR
jgi:hypothetical protein